MQAILPTGPGEDDQTGTFSRPLAISAAGRAGPVTREVGPVVQHVDDSSRHASRAYPFLLGNTAPPGKRVLPTAQCGEHRANALPTGTSAASNRVRYDIDLEARREAAMPIPLTRWCIVKALWENPHD